MNEYTLGDYNYLLLLLILPLIAVLVIYDLRWRNKKIRTFADHKFQMSLFPNRHRFSKFIPTLYLIAVFFIILSMVDIIAGKEKVKTEQKVNNLIFLLDVSNSMNAEDIAPNRLAQAKNIIINTLPQLSNARLGMIVFAGQASSIMPFTSDFSAVESYLKGMETTVIAEQGTDFLAALEISAQKFKNVSKGARRVVIISDGEDNEEHTDKAIDLALNEGIQITTVGVGTKEGAPVPVYIQGQLIGYKTNNYGETIMSQRQEDNLKKMAQKTGGEYIDGNNLDSAIQKIAREAQNSNSKQKMLVDSQNSKHYYQYLLAVSLVLFFIIYLFNPKKDLNT